MIIWGSRGRTLKLGSAGSESCSTCEQSRNFNLYLDYRYGHLYWIIRVVTQRQYYRMCEICRHGSMLDRKEVEARLGTDPIPAFDRYGLAVAGAVFALMFGLVLLANA